MTQPSLFNGEAEVIDFLLTQMKAINPNVHYEPLDGTGNREFNIWFTGIKEATHVKTTMELYPVLSEFDKTGNLNVLVDFINTQAALFSRVANLSEGRVRLDVTDSILPIVRPADFSPYASKDVKEVSDAVGKGVKIMYAYDSPKGLEFIHQGSIPPGFTHDSLTDKAFENLKSNGWMEHKHKHDGPGADLYVFEGAGRAFQAQFLVSEWTKTHLGEEFYFAFPTMESAFVMVPRRESEYGIFQLLGGGPQHALKSLANQVYHTHEKSLSPVAYSFKKGKIDVL